MKNVRTVFRNIDRWRRDKMRLLEPMLYYSIKNSDKNDNGQFNNDEIKSILIIRNNKRIGNIYFLIPFVRQIRENYPNAIITLMLQLPWQGQVFQNMGIDSFCYSNFSFKNSLKFRREMRKQKKNHYDLIITPNSSVEDAMMASMLTARYKVGPHNELRLPAYTHTFRKNDDREHAALDSLFLIEAMGNTIHEPISHHIEFSADELQQGTKDKLEVYSGNELTIAYFRGARGKKELSELTWRTLLKKFEDAYDKPIKWIEILSPDITEPLNADITTYSNKNMRVLASFLKNVDAFICCDTGPLHLADAAGVNCIGLYNKTSPEKFGVLGEHCVNVTDIDNIDTKNILDIVNELKK